MVRLGENQIAEVYFQNEWVPICGHWFWNNNIGATLFCQELGFQYGYIKNQSDLPNDGLRIGQCNRNCVKYSSHHCCDITNSHFFFFCQNAKFTNGEIQATRN